MAKNIVADMVIEFDICGNEEMKTAPESGNPFTQVATRTLKVEPGASRSHEFTFGEYKTTSVNYPTWHASAG